MATLKTTVPQTWAVNNSNNIQAPGLWQKFTAFAEGQHRNQTLWFFLTLMVHGVLVLPVPAVLIYYFNAPEWVLGITMVCFFANLIANMGGAGIRASIGFFLGSLFIHLVLILAFVL